MRNEARRGATTKIHLIGDLETRFSPSFAAKVRPLTQQLVNGELGKAVLVYRRFEMDESVAYPTDMKEFKSLVDKEKMIQFHVQYYKVGHFIPNLEQWLDYSVNNETVTIEKVAYDRSEWEPQFIMTHDTPYHYEHAPTRSMDHQFLCFELCRSGYSYYVMSHVYNIHLGIKKQLNALEMSVGMYGLTQKAAVMARYAVYINSRYPVNETAKCPHWDNYI
uniref:Piwi domain-containing protein n=1 Tax=Panagrellus redivivus TaxID=6233 RepID=A0A7E4VAQ4_PANRE